jgi:hypothetical protein
MPASKYSYKKLDKCDPARKTIISLRCFKKIVLLVHEIDFAYPAFLPFIDYVQSFTSEQDRNVVVDEFINQLSYKMSVDFDIFFPNIPKFLTNIETFKILEQESSFKEKCIKLYYKNDDDDEKMQWMAIPIFTKKYSYLLVHEVLMKYCVPYAYPSIVEIPSFDYIIYENALINTFDVLKNYFETTEIDIEALIHVDKQQILNRMHSLFTSDENNVLSIELNKILILRANPQTNQHFFSTLIEIYIFYAEHKNIMQKINSSKFNSLFKSMHEDDIEKYFGTATVSMKKMKENVSDNQIVGYTLKYYSQKLNVDF